MNTTTRELIEREIAKEERGRHWAVESIEHFQRELKQAEAKRDAHAEKIGALKEDLARGERDDASQRRFNDLIRSFTAVP